MRTKEEYRIQIQSQRSALTSQEWKFMSEAVCHNLLEVEALASAKRVHSFWPLLDKKEVDIRPFLNHMNQSGVEIFLPVMRGAQMHHGIFKGEDAMTSGQFGILEPTEFEAFFPDHLDAVIIPALALDYNGNRIGYGQGIYDRFLSSVHCPLISPIFSHQIVSGIPMESHDVCVHMLVTEHHIHHVKNV